MALALRSSLLLYLAHLPDAFILPLLSLLFDPDSLVFNLRCLGTVGPRYAL
jgi:hypothetical protein